MTAKAPVRRCAQTTTAEVRLDEEEATSSSTARRESDDLAADEVGCG